MRLVVTRPKPDGPRLAARLEQLGHHVMLAPLMTVEFDKCATLPAGPWQAVLATSANGLRAIEQIGHLHQLRNLPVLAVGPASAGLAARLGFSKVHSADGNVADLCKLVRQTLNPQHGRLLYLTGASRAGDLQADLAEHGYAVDRLELYAAVPASELPSETRAALAGREVDAVLLYSPRTARIWSDLIRLACLEEQLSTVVHVCLSQAVADSVKSSLDQDLTIALADRPNDDAMLDGLSNLHPSG